MRMPCWVPYTAPPTCMADAIVPVRDKSPRTPTDRHNTPHCNCQLSATSFLTSSRHSQARVSSFIVAQQG